MSQSRKQSAVETAVQMVVGYVALTALQMAVFPLFGLDANLGEHAAVSAIMAAGAFVKSYTVRRLFARRHQ